MKTCLVALALVAVGCVGAEDHQGANVSQRGPRDGLGGATGDMPPIVNGPGGSTGAGGAVVMADAGVTVDADFSAVPDCSAWEVPGKAIQVSLICPDQVHAICYANPTISGPGPQAGPCSLFDGQNRHLICTGACGATWTPMP